MLTPIQLPLSPSLRLTEQAAVDVPGALDALNVEPDLPVRSRAGVARLVAPEAGKAILDLGFSKAGVPAILRICRTQVKAFGVDGVVRSSAAVGDAVVGQFAHVATPLLEKTYIATGDDFVSWDGTSFVVNPTITYNGVGGSSAPRPSIVGVTSLDSRLIAGGFLDPAVGPAGASSPPSRVYFAERGDPTVWNSNWREDYAPGDGERLVACVRWNDRNFLFKQTKLFVVYGTSADSVGNPTLDSFMLDVGIGAAGPGCVAAGPDGIYIVDRRGIFLTDGSTVEAVAPELDPLFGVGSAHWYTGKKVNVGDIASSKVTVVGDRVIISLPSSTGRFVLVSDRRVGGWTVWDLEMSAIATIESEYADVLIGERAGAIVRQQAGRETDENDLMRSFVRSGWTSFGIAGSKTSRQTRVWGMGNLTMQLAVDYAPLTQPRMLNLRAGVDMWGDGTDAGDLWGDGSTYDDKWAGGAGVADGWMRHGLRGSLHSTWIGSVDESSFAVQAIEHHLDAMTGAVQDAAAVGKS